MHPFGNMYTSIYKVKKVAHSPRDPYAANPPKRIPQLRTRNPLDPREPYRTRFTQAPVTRLFPPTGSLYYRCGLFNGRSMTLKEQRFEQYVNDMQARHDEISDLREWERQKDVEEEAIALCYELKENMANWSQEMKTRDQNEVEFQCHRERQKAKNLDPQKPLKALQAMEMIRQQTIRDQEAQEIAREQERIRSKKIADFQARIQASSNPVADTEIITNTIESQQASQQSGLTRSKPEIRGNASQTVPCTGADSSRQQEWKPRSSTEEIRLQFLDLVRSSPATSTKATMPTATVTTTTVRSTGFQPGIGTYHNAHYPRENTLEKKPPGSTNWRLRRPSKAEQSVVHITGQRSKTLPDQRFTASDEHPSASPSPHHTSSQKSTPPSSANPSPPKSPTQCTPKAREIMLTHGLTLNKPKEQIYDSKSWNESNKQIDNTIPLQKLEKIWYGDAKPGRWARMKSSTRRDPVLRCIIDEHLDRVMLRPVGPTEELEREVVTGKETGLKKGVNGGWHL